MDPVPAPLVRPGRPADAAALAAFGERSFRDAFAAENRPADLELYLSSGVSMSIGAGTEKAMAAPSS